LFFFINGSGFENKIPLKSQFILHFKEHFKIKTNIIIEQGTLANLDNLLKEFKLFQLKCFKLYNNLNIKFIIIGISSGGILLVELKKY
jgi:hypothetical protein